MSLKRFFLDMRSRSRPVVQDSSAPEPRDDMEQSGWANMPSELLRDIFMRIEESEASWPLRKSVVACAGVCRSWRIISKEIVLTLEVSGRLTFPISLKQVSEYFALVVNLADFRYIWYGFELIGNLNVVAIMMCFTLKTWSKGSYCTVFHKAKQLQSDLSSLPQFDKWLVIYMLN
ncbi:Tubby-like F-box protein 3, partial [Cucurbita argyrosperma subsp. argyrosperma]